jgi:thymidylate synthase
MNVMTVQDIRDHFAKEFQERNFTVDKTGDLTIELLGASFIADEDCIFGKLNAEYIKKELDWYIGQSTNINDIYGEERDAPVAWKYAADKYGNVNSNYGNLIFSEEFNKQYKNVLDELTIGNKFSRRATMVYTRPSIWNEYNKGGKSDFICTNAVTYYIRDNELHAVVQMRSNDVWAGYRNDLAWQQYVLQVLAAECSQYFYHEKDEGIITPGSIHWQVQNLHIYEKNFYLVDNYIKTGDIFISKDDYNKKYNT